MHVIYNVDTFKCTGEVLYYTQGKPSIELPDNTVLPLDLASYEVNVAANSISLAVQTAEELLEQQKATVQKFTDIVTLFIQYKVDEYNAVNGTAFESVHNCESYSRITGYTHQAFCSAVWLWSVQVWETIRTYQSTATTVPTNIEFQTLLDSIPLTY